MDNYDTDVNEDDYPTEAEAAEEQDFLDAVMATQIMREAYDFLQATSEQH